MSTPSAALLIRPSTEADAPAIQAIYAPIVRDTAISFEDVPPTVAEIAERIRATLPTYPYFVCETQDGVLGFAYAGAHRARAAYRWSVDVTVYVDAAAHRRGIGLALYRHLIDILERQGFHAAFAGIALPNPKSIGLHEALGFVHLGTYARSVSSSAPGAMWAGGADHWPPEAPRTTPFRFRSCHQPTPSSWTRPR
jgi:L-amino acid N-acyltransferase YncA